ncbi:MAG: hypothetical protein J6Y13_03470 [Treponema sp.]|nr:hypothetical protein [Treponema sp.]
MKSITKIVLVLSAVCAVSTGALTGCSSQITDDELQQEETQHGQTDAGRYAESYVEMASQ